MSPITDRYPEGSWSVSLYRRLRLRLGGLKRIVGLFPEEGLIVDLGCGMGLLAHLLVEGQEGRQVLAVDHDAERVQMLHKSAVDLRIEARQADMAEMEIPPCRGVALVDVLHYLDPAAQEALIQRAALALEPGGVLVLRDPDPSAPLRYGLARAHEKLALGLGWTKAELGSFRSGEEWALLLCAHGLTPDVLPLSRLSPYADRIVVGVKS